MRKLTKEEIKKIEDEEHKAYYKQLKSGIKTLHKIMFNKDIDFSNLESEIDKMKYETKSLIKGIEDEKQRAWSYMTQAKRFRNLIRFKHPEIRETYVHDIKKDFNPSEYEVVDWKDDVYLILKKGDDTKILHEHFYEELIAIYMKIENERKIIEKVPVKNNKQKIFSEIRNKLINTKSRRKNNILAIAEVVYTFEGELDTGEIHSKVIDKIKSRKIVIECLEWLRTNNYIVRERRKKHLGDFWWWIYSHIEK